MRLARAVAFAAALAGGTMVGADAVDAQGMILGITIRASNPQPVRPQAPVNTLHDLMRAFIGCWNPPPLDAAHQPVDVVFQVSFKRSGELFGKPPSITFGKA